MANNTFKYAINNIGLDNVLQVPIDVATGIDIGDANHVFEVTGLCPDGTTSATIRDTVYDTSASDSKILVENTIDSIKDLFKKYY